MRKFVDILILTSFLFCIHSLKASNLLIDSVIISKKVKFIYKNDVLPFDTIPQMHKDDRYMVAFNELSEMLYGNKQLDLKRAVYLVEASYITEMMSYQNFCNEIALEVKKINRYIDVNNIRKYKTCVNAALFDYFTKPNWMNNYKAYSYDVVDPGGERDITKLFVTKLLKTHTGQCQSMPFYYKILCNELNGSAYLAFCPNHLYIKHIGDDGKWYNIELTTGSFARDDWYIETMDISTEAIKKGTFLTAISEKEEIAYMFVMLAETYRFKYKNYDYFTLLCADTILKILPNNCYALYLKLQTLQQWIYDYLHIIGLVNSDFIRSIVSERNDIIEKLSQAGFSTITDEQYIRNVEKSYKQLGKEIPQNIRGLKNE